MTNIMVRYFGGFSRKTLRFCRKGKGVCFGGFIGAFRLAWNRLDSSSFVPNSVGMTKRTQPSFRYERSD